MSEHAASTSVRIPLTHGYAAIIDAEDAVRVTAHKWRAFVRPNRSGEYVVAQAEVIRDDGSPTLVSLQHFILGAPDGVHVDHKDRDTLNNRRANLRLATHSQNQANRKGWSRHGYKGVAFRRGHNGAPRQKPYEANIKHNSKTRSLGYFATPEEAARAYDAAARELFGEFAFLNFPDTTE